MKCWMHDYSQLVVTLGTGKTGVVCESLDSGGYNDIPVTTSHPVLLSLCTIIAFELLGQIWNYTVDERRAWRGVTLVVFDMKSIVHTSSPRHLACVSYYANRTTTDAHVVKYLSNGRTRNTLILKTMTHVTEQEGTAASGTHKTEHCNVIHLPKQFQVSMCIWYRMWNYALEYCIYGGINFWVSVLYRSPPSFQGFWGLPMLYLPYHATQPEGQHSQKARRSGYLGTRKKPRHRVGRGVAIKNNTFRSRRDLGCAG